MERKEKGRGRGEQESEGGKGLDCGRGEVGWTGLGWPWRVASAGEHPKPVRSVEAADFAVPQLSHSPASPPLPLLFPLGFPS